MTPPFQNTDLGPSEGAKLLCGSCPIGEAREATYLAAWVSLAGQAKGADPKWRWFCEVCVKKAQGQVFFLVPTRALLTQPSSPTPTPPVPKPHSITTYGFCMGYMGEGGPLDAAYLVIERPSSQFPWRLPITEGGRWNLPLLHTRKRPDATHEDAAHMVYKAVKITIEVELDREDEPLAPPLGDVP